MNNLLLNVACDFSHSCLRRDDPILDLESDANMKSKHSSGSGLWKHGLLITLLFGFTVMLVGGFFLYKTRAPIPKRVVGPDATVLFTGEDIQAGQELFRKRDLMNYGSVLGHGEIGRPHV